MTIRGALLRPEHVVHLRTERLVMRRFSLEDPDLIVDLDSDPEVVRWVGQLEPTTHERVEQTIMPSSSRRSS
jgi:hypothetical protein